MTKQTDMPALEVGGTAGGARRQNPPDEKYDERNGRIALKNSNTEDMTTRPMMKLTAKVDEAKKRIWVMSPRINDLSFAEKLAKKAAEGVDVRILVDYWGVLPSAVDRLVHEWDNVIDAAKRLYSMDPWDPSLSRKVTETHRRVQTMKEELGRNLKVAIMPDTEMHYDLYIVDEMVFSSIWKRLDVNTAETWFMEHWKNYADKSPIFKLFGNVTAAKKRIWIAMRRVKCVMDADLFVRRAAEGVDVRIAIAKDSNDLIETINYYAGVIEDMRAWMAELIIKLPFSIFNKDNLSYYKEVIKEIVDKYGDTLFKYKKSLLKRNLNVIETPVIDEFYIVDDKAWVDRGGKLKEVDVKDAEEMFMTLLSKYRPTTDRKA